jgi:N-acyl-D-amino-acid deacylase
MSADLVIRGGTVLDGGGDEPFVADVAITGGKITAIGHAPCGRSEIDATGLYVSPGFIDIHSHSDYTLLVDPRAVSAIHQGVTLEVIGNCGFGCAPVSPTAAESIYGYNGSVPLAWQSLGGYFERLEAARPAVNVISLVPNGQLRRAVVGVADRPADAEELSQMKSLLAQNLDEGGWGYSTGLEYPAESGAPDEEIAELCTIAARKRRLYATHVRRRDAGAISAIDEAIRVAEKAGAQLQISHLLPRKTVEGEDQRALELIDGAQRRGLAVAFDMHTRQHGMTFLDTLLPPWAHADRGRHLASPESRRRMREYQSIVAGGGWDRVVLLEHPAFPQYSHRSLGEIAREEGRDAYDIAFDILQRDVADATRAIVLIKAYTPDQQALVFSHPLCMPASDATTLAPDGPLAREVFHGAYTWASWYFHFMVRERRLLSAAKAVQRMTELPARTLGLKTRGRIKEGYWADIAVFDGAEFKPVGTTLEPNRLARGMRHVLVNGVPTLRDGTLTGVRAGQVIRQSC